MICYFSGTGNTRLVAEALGALLDDAITPITTAPSVIEDATLGLVFPLRLGNARDLCQMA